MARNRRKNRDLWTVPWKDTAFAIYKKKIVGQPFLCRTMDLAERISINYGDPCLFFKI